VKRREFIAMLGGGTAMWPLAARAQQTTMPVIGFLSTASPELYAIRLRAFHQGLKEAGYVEGQNVQVAGQRTNTLDCRRLRPNWSTAKWP